jgi:hypothetical protein
MRAREFVAEAQSKLPQNHQDATPDMRSHPGLDNSSPYLPWRFSAHFLAGADGTNPYEHEPNKLGPNGQALVTVAYTDVEDAMILQAEKAFGAEAHAKNLTSRGSTEADYVNKTSPIKGFKGYGR